MQHAGRLLGLDDDELAVHAVPDLGATGHSDQLRRRPERHDLAGANHGHPVSELLRLVEVVRRQENRLPEQAQRADHVPRRPASRRVETRRRLVEEHEVGVADERRAEVEPPLLTAGERLHFRVALLGKPDELDHLVDVPRLRVVAREHAMHLADGEQRRVLRVLEDDADALAKRGRRVARVVAEHRGNAGVAPAVALEDLDGRRLAGAVRAEEPEDLACGHLEADPAERLDAAVRLAQVADADRSRHAASRRRV